MRACVRLALLGPLAIGAAVGWYAYWTWREWRATSPMGGQGE